MVAVSPTSRPLVIVPTSEPATATQASPAPLPQAVIQTSRVSDVDDYQRMVRGVRIEATRLGVGAGPNTVTGVVDEHFVATTCQIGFPIAVRSVVPDNRLVIAAMGTAPPGSRWCEVDLQLGTTMVYAPDSEHAAVNLPGLRFTFTVVEADALAARTDLLGISAHGLERGRVGDFIDRPGAWTVADRLLTIPSLQRGLLPASQQDELLSEIAFMLAGPWPGRLREPPRRLDRRRTVARCIEYAESIDRLPSTSELCVVSGTSARTVRRAFVSVFGVPPMTYFRDRALSRAHRSLLSAGASGDTVTAVALRFGFSHLGRFSHYYSRVHGENPSATLRAARGGEGLTLG
jgi:AraC-like DNA-binding protein